ncbi:MAG: ankyrin repeat domain-containing protein [Burkholderiaceae bacterium]|nr:ankyrin repeat domain-containing protein [Burkholderiaceae bacterium]
MEVKRLTNVLLRVSLGVAIFFGALQVTFADSRKFEPMAGSEYCSEWRSELADRYPPDMSEIKAAMASGKKADFAELVWRQLDLSEIPLTEQQRGDVKTIEREMEMLGAVASGDVATVKRLLAEGVDPNFRPTFPMPIPALATAAACGQVDIVNVLLDAGADVNLRFEFDMADSEVYNSTALIWAAENGQADVVKVLLARGANVDAYEEAYDRHGKLKPARSALYAANDHDVLALLVPKAKQLEEPDWYGDTMLRFMVNQEDSEIACMLIKHGADPYYKNKKGETPASVARKKHLGEILDCIAKSPRVLKKNRG